MSRNVRQRTFGHVHPAKIQISLIRIFTGCILDNQGWKVSSCRERRLWSDCADTQIDLRLRWAHMSESTFPHIAAQITSSFFHCKAEKQAWCYSTFPQRQIQKLVLNSPMPDLQTGFQLIVQTYSRTPTALKDLGPWNCDVWSGSFLFMVC